MFTNPVIDKETSIKYIIHLYKIDNEYIETIELVYPSEDLIDLQSLLAMRDALERSSQKIEKIIDTIIL